MDLPPASILSITLMVILMPRIVGCPKQTLGLIVIRSRFFNGCLLSIEKCEILSRYVEQGLFVGEGVPLFKQVGEGCAR